MRARRAKRRRRREHGLGGWAVVGILLLVLPAAGACRQERPALSAAEEARLDSVGRAAAGSLATGLMGRLREAVEERGPAGAVSFCSDRAIPLTREIEGGLGPGIEVKRTSVRYRNPANAPDSLEAAALRYFEAADDEAGGGPSSYVQHAGDGEWRYYRPLTVQPLCVRCHGPAEELAPGVRRVLEEEYPADRATGYRPGDFRGVIRVSVPVERLREAGES